jgi:hypothetical protein
MLDNAAVTVSSNPVSGPKAARTQVCRLRFDEEHYRVADAVHWIAEVQPQVTKNLTRGNVNREQFRKLIRARIPDSSFVMQSCQGIDPNRTHCWKEARKYGHKYQDRGG